MRMGPYPKLILALALLAACTSAYAMRQYWEYGIYYDEIGNAVGDEFIGCAGPPVRTGQVTANYVVIQSERCDYGYGWPDPNDEGP